MSSTSLSDVIQKYMDNSTSQNDGSEQSDGYSNSIRYTEDKYSIGSIEHSSFYENSPSTRSAKMEISEISTAASSINEKISPPSEELKDIENVTKRLQTESDSFNSHTNSNYDQNICLNTQKAIAAQLTGDLQLPLAEEQDANAIACGNINLCQKKGLTNNADPIENLVVATLAFREASHNQCDLLRAQTIAINRLAMAIEDQNVMMRRFHTVVQKTSTKNLPDNDSPSKDDQQ